MLISGPLRPSLSVVDDPWITHLLLSVSPNKGCGCVPFHISKSTSTPAAGDPRKTSKTWVVIGGRVRLGIWDVFPAEASEAGIKCPPRIFTRSSRVEKRTTLTLTKAVAMQARARDLPSE